MKNILNNEKAFGITVLSFSIGCVIAGGIAAHAISNADTFQQLNTVKDTSESIKTLETPETKPQPTIEAVQSDQAPIDTPAVTEESTEPAPVEPPKTQPKVEVAPEPAPVEEETGGCAPNEDAPEKGCRPVMKGICAIDMSKCVKGTSNGS